MAPSQAPQDRCPENQGANSEKTSHHTDRRTALVTLGGIAFAGVYGAFSFDSLRREVNGVSHRGLLLIKELGLSKGAELHFKGGPSWGVKDHISFWPADTLTQPLISPELLGKEGFYQYFLHHQRLTRIQLSLLAAFGPERVRFVIPAGEGLLSRWDKNTREVLSSLGGKINALTNLEGDKLRSTLDAYYNALKESPELFKLFVEHLHVGGRIAAICADQGWGDIVCGAHPPKGEGRLDRLHRSLRRLVREGDLSDERLDRELDRIRELAATERGEGRIVLNDTIDRMRGPRMIVSVIGNEFLQERDDRFDLDPEELLSARSSDNRYLWRTPSFFQSLPEGERSLLRSKPLYLASREEFRRYLGEFARE